MQKPGHRLHLIRTRGQYTRLANVRTKPPFDRSALIPFNSPERLHLPPQKSIEQPQPLERVDCKISPDEDQGGGGQGNKYPAQCHGHQKRPAQLPDCPFLADFPVYPHAVNVGTANEQFHFPACLHAVQQTSGHAYVLQALPANFDDRCLERGARPDSVADSGEPAFYNCLTPHHLASVPILF